MYQNVRKETCSKPIIYHQVTGVLNNETVEVMKAPRCGVSDVSRYGHFHGKPRWKKRLITYRYLKNTIQRSLVSCVTFH